MLHVIYKNSDVSDNNKDKVNTYFPSCAFIIQRTKSNCRQENGNVEEDSRGGIFK